MIFNYNLTFVLINYNSTIVFNYFNPLFLKPYIFNYNSTICFHYLIPLFLKTYISNYILTFIPNFNIKKAPKCIGAFLMLKYFIFKFILYSFFIQTFYYLFKDLLLNLLNCHCEEAKPTRQSIYLL